MKNMASEGSPNLQDGSPLVDRGPAEHISLCETLDRVLNKGVVIHGDLTISVANVDLIYLGLPFAKQEYRPALCGAPAWKSTPTMSRTASVSSC